MDHQPLLSLAIEPWLSALIGAVVLFGAAAVIAVTAKRQVDEALRPTPEQTSESVREDVRYLKERTSR